MTKSEFIAAVANFPDDAEITVKTFDYDRTIDQVSYSAELNEIRCQGSCIENTEDRT